MNTQIMIIQNSELKRLYRSAIERLDSADKQYFEDRVRNCADPASFTDIARTIWSTSKRIKQFHQPTVQAAFEAAVKEFNLQPNEQDELRNRVLSSHICSPYNNKPAPLCAISTFAQSVVQTGN